MTTFDTIAAIVLCLSIVYSIFRGFIKEVFSLLSYIGGFILAVNFQSVGATIAMKIVSSPATAKVIGFIIIFIAASIIIRLIGSMVQKVFRSADVLSLFDRVLGGGVGLAKGVLFLIVFLLPLELFPKVHASVTEGSVIAPYLENITRNLRDNMDQDKDPNSPLNKVKGKIKEAQEMKNSAEKMQKSVGKMTQGDGAPQENYSPEDKKKLNKLMESIQKQ